MAGPDGAARGDARPTPDPDVPAQLRSALVRFAAEVLGGSEPAQVPSALTAVRRFAPRRRATAGAAPLWAALREDPAFRAHVTQVWLRAHATPSSDEDGVAAEAGTTGAATGDPLDAAVGAWLRDEPWQHLVPATAPGPAAGDAEVRRLAAVQAEAARLRAELGLARDAERAARDELAGLQRELRRLRSDADRARSEARAAAAAAAHRLEAAERAAEDARAERERAAQDLRAAAAERASARDEARAGQRLAAARVRLLLDTLVGAASGLRAELALPPVDALPADLVAPPPPVPPRPTSRGRTVDDPALLDELLRLPRAHLLVDGYNVSKTGWPGVPLADQRRLLVHGAAALATQTGAEVTCCFDGQEGHRAAASVRGVRVLFTEGTIADDLLRRLVAAEPAGRVVVVATSDREVVRDVEAAGAWAVPSATLVERLRRS